MKTLELRPKFEFNGQFFTEHFAVEFVTTDPKVPQPIAVLIDVPILKTTVWAIVKVKIGNEWFPYFAIRIQL